MKKIELKNALCDPIRFQYAYPSAEQIKKMQMHAAPHLIKKEGNILPVNVYYLNKLKGAEIEMKTRSFVFQKIQTVAQSLLPHYGLMIFDAFRKIETQADLFNSICDEVRIKHPDWNKEAIEKEAKKFAAHPNDPGRFAIPPHNSGGAIDLAIYDLHSGEVCQFGTGFDAVEAASKTDFFEKDYDSQYAYTEDEWQIIQYNRRILFNLMKKAGFTNYREEWWHYDLGDCLWAIEFGIEWVFSSMEET